MAKQTGTINQQLVKLTEVVAQTRKVTSEVKKDVCEIKKTLESVSVKNGNGMNMKVPREEFEGMIYDCVRKNGRIDKSIDSKLLLYENSHNNFKKLKIFTGKAGIVFAVIKYAIGVLFVIFILYELFAREPFLRTNAARAIDTEQHE